MKRHLKLTSNFTNLNFESEVVLVQQENSKLLSQLKGDLSIKSAYVFSSISKDLVLLTDKFFEKKFQSNA